MSSSSSSASPSSAKTPDSAARKREIYTQAFKVYDTDGSNSIDAGELGSLLKDLGWKVADEDVEEALQSLDADGNGDIDLDEFLNWSNYAWEKYVLHSPAKRKPKDKVASSMALGGITED